MGNTHVSGWKPLLTSDVENQVHSVIQTVNLTRLVKVLSAKRIHDLCWRYPTIRKHAF